MPKKRTRTKKQLVPNICASRINYAKLKEDKKFKEGHSLSVTPEPSEAPGHDQNFKTNDVENQGHGLTGALAPLRAHPRRWAGVLMGENSIVKAREVASALGIALENGSKPNCRIDYDRYRELFDDLDVSDAQKDQMIEALFHIGLVFYDMGFGVEFGGPACGQLDQGADDSAAGRQDMVSSEPTTLSKIFNRYAA